ncbi:hypothetical protein JXQ70_19855 [bacterium]|nr:hypothetical protein [bacterium]
MAKLRRKNVWSRCIFHEVIHIKPDNPPSEWLKSLLSGIKYEAELFYTSTALTRSMLMRNKALFPQSKEELVLVQGEITRMCAGLVRKEGESNDTWIRRIEHEVMNPLNEFYQSWGTDQEKGPFGTAQVIGALIDILEGKQNDLFGHIDIDTPQKKRNFVARRLRYALENKKIGHDGISLVSGMHGRETEMSPKNWSVFYGVSRNFRELTFDSFRRFLLFSEEKWKNIFLCRECGLPVYPSRSPQSSCSAACRIKYNSKMRSVDVTRPPIK